TRSVVYVERKQKAAMEVGIECALTRFPANITIEKVLGAIADLNEQPEINGMIVQLPLPSHLDTLSIVRSILPTKDVDGLHPENQGLLLQGAPRFIPATPRGVLELLKRNGYQTRGKHVVVVGRSNIVGKPLAAALLCRGEMGDATVTVAHKETENLKSICKAADILVVAIGDPGFITSEFVKPGAVVVDVGITVVEGKLKGDLDFDSVKDVAGAISPVPGGIGPITVAMLLLNTLDAAERQK
ncbi:MAG: bifunctional 5,10-methylenetetrahydrofolate dehydrogenase/5,10-methenyltetrahydrofolate cyclohydrolase, partial [Patescibacteria group bacterium]